MIKLLHSADWHLGSPLTGFSSEQACQLRQALLSIPQRTAALCRAEGCQLLLLAGDIFDGPASAQTVAVLRDALEEAGCPVLIAPGNHDFIASDSPWLSYSWPGNVHIFTQPELRSLFLPELNCRVYGAGYTAMDCPGLLEGFTAGDSSELSIGLLHADPTGTSPYCPVTAAQLNHCGLSYLALGHIHKAGQLRQGSTLCAWPGTPMGRGWDETGEKGVYLVTIGAESHIRQVSLGLPRFFDLTAEVTSSPTAAIDALLPAAGNRDFYRITLTGVCDPFSSEALGLEFSRFPNLTVRNKTVAPADCFRTAGEDSLEGVFFALLRDAAELASSEAPNIPRLAAEISRRLLDGQEVTL